MSWNSSSCTLNFSATSSVPGFTDVLTLPAGSTVYLDLDLSDVNACQGMISVLTAGSSGISVSVVPGQGASFPVNIYQPVPCYLWAIGATPNQTNQIYASVGLSSSTVPDPITMAPVVPNQVGYTPFVFSSPFYINSKLQRFRITSLESVRSCIIQVFLNV